jgi:ribonuclease P protein component
VKGSLKSSEFSLVFNNGDNFFTYPIRLIYLIQVADNKPFMKASVVVPKKFIKKAIYRNRIKRMMRAAFHEVEIVLRGTILDKSYQFIFIYAEKEEMPFKIIFDSIKRNVEMAAHIE